MSDDPYFLREEYQSRGIDRKALAILLSCIKPELAGYTFGLLSLLVSSALTIGAARFLGLLIEKGFQPRDLQAIWKYAAAVLLAEAASIGLSYLGRRAFARCSSSTIYHLRTRMFAKLQTLPMSYFDRSPLGRTVTRLTNDVEGLEDFFGNMMGQLTLACFLVLSAGASMLITDFTIGVFLVLGMVPAMGLTFILREQVRRLNLDMLQKSSSINARLAEYFNGLSVIRSFGIEAWAKRSFDQRVLDHLEASLKLNRLYAWSRPVINLLCMLPLCILLWWGGPRVLAGAMSLGLLVTFIRYCERFIRPIMELSHHVHVIQAALASAERVAEFLSRPDEQDVLGPDGKYVPAVLKGEITFEDVSLSYDGQRSALSQLHFEISAGQTIGLVGATGSGKTSTISLLSRLYPHKGRILLDGHLLEEYSRNALRRQIGLVSQEVVIIKASVRDNLLLGIALGDTELEEACELTGFAQVMRNRHLTFDTLILDKGANLSVGERQLLALTRILLRDPAILILDEATANIDRRYERLVHDAVDRLMKGRTCLIIAHRLETLDRCSHLLVFKDGALAESGTTADLLAADGVFKALWRDSSQWVQEQQA